MSIIAISGTHGTGKTTLVYKLSHELKLKEPDKKIGVLIEQIQWCPFPINKDGNFKTQLWYMTTQLKSELEYKNVYDVVVSDRTVYDILAYSFYCCDKKEYKFLYNFTLNLPCEYDTIYVNSILKNDYLIDDGVRDTDHEYRRKIETKLNEIYCELLKRKPETNIIWR